MPSLHRMLAGFAPTPHWPPLLATRGPGGRSARHAHHGMHLVVALDGALLVRSDAGEITAPGVLTAPDVPHEIDARGAEVLVVFLDRESDVGRCLAQGLTAPVRALTAPERRALDPAADPLAIMQRDGVAWVRRAAAALGVVGPELPPRRVDPRVRRALAHVRATPAGDHSLAALAAVAGLSPGRFHHVFTASVGIPLRPYLSWLRLQHAAGLVVTGSALTEAALTAGFSDGAHMSRAFRRTIGLAPRDLRPRRS